MKRWSVRLRLAMEPRRGWRIVQNNGWALLFFNMEENKEWFFNNMKTILQALIAVNQQKFQSCKGYLGWKKRKTRQVSAHFILSNDMQRGDSIAKSFDKLEFTKERIWEGDFEKYFEKLRRVKPHFIFDILKLWRLKQAKNVFICGLISI